jgi:Cu(I)/Ag(I) efflux system membrane fusion protein
MRVIKKATWTMTILGAVAGCAGEGDQAPAPAAGPSTTPTVSQPTTAPAPPLPTGKSAAKGDEAPAVEGPKADNVAPATGAGSLTAAEIAGIKKLPEAEQASATKQLVCPVSSEHLGAMGMPIKVSAEGRTVYLCCKGCEGDFKADPKSFFAKLDKKP